MLERSRDPDVASSTLSTVSTLLDLVDWEYLLAQSRRAESLGPIIDPTAFQSSMANGTLHRNIAVLKATVIYLDDLHVIEADRVAREEVFED